MNSVRTPPVAYAISAVAEVDEISLVRRNISVSVQPEVDINLTIVPGADSAYVKYLDCWLTTTHKP